MSLPDRLRRITVDDEYMDIDFLSIEAARSSSQSRSAPVSSPKSNASGFSRIGTVNNILHQVSRLDTLAGVAVRYGVEVADIKRLNGLSCDLQMFALKTLQIPSPGKHPTSPSFTNVHTNPLQSCASEKGPSKHQDIDLFDSFQSLKLSPSLEKKAISSLQANEPNSSSLSSPPLSPYRKSRSVSSSLMSAANVNNLHDSLLLQDDDSSTGTDKWILRRRPKSVNDFTSYPPEENIEETSDGGTDSTISENGAFSSLWATSMWILKPNFFDGLPPRAIGMKGKTALD